LTSDPGIEVRPAAPDELAESLKFLEGFLREGEPVPLSFVWQFRRAVESGELEVLAAWTGRRVVGVAVLAYRLSISAGATFASIEDLYVGPVVRRRGVGRVLLEAVEKRCRERGVSYVEVQTDDEAAPFYAALGYEPESGVWVLSRSYTL
jgi:GNAT superfamily N-acetyltransferase